MLFVQRELERIQGVLTLDEKPQRYDELYAVQQALVWVLDSDTFKAPRDMLAMSTQEDSGDCPEGNDRLLCSDSPDHRVC
jgi:hypothetical protein